MLVGRCSWELSGRKLQRKIKSHNSEPTRISYFTALSNATYVVLPKENHMQLTEAQTLDRKSGEADLSRHAVEGSAVLTDPSWKCFLTGRTQLSRLAIFATATHAAYD